MIVNNIDPAIPPRKLPPAATCACEGSREKLAEGIRDRADRSHETEANLRSVGRHSVARQIVNQIGKNDRKIGAAEVVAGIAQCKEETPFRRARR